jgi:hypothetical protein
MDEGKHCRNCDTLLLGPYCHQCGQQHFDQVLSTRDYIRDVAQRVYRFDGIFWRTIVQSFKSTGSLANNYLQGRRRGILDPVRYFTATLFVQFVVIWLLSALADFFHKPEVLNWVVGFVGFAAIRFLFIFWFGSLWYLFFPPKKRELSEIYVFATYALATAGLVWLPLPMLELLLPQEIGASKDFTLAVKIAFEAAFLVYAVFTMTLTSAWVTLWRCLVVIGGGVSVLYGISLLF